MSSQEIHTDYNKQNLIKVTYLLSFENTVYYIFNYYLQYRIETEIFHSLAGILLILQR